MSNVSFGMVKFIDAKSYNDFGGYLKGQNAAAQDKIMNNFKKMDEACEGVDLYLKSTTSDGGGFYLFAGKDMDSNKLLAGINSTENDAFNEFASKALKVIPRGARIKKFLAEHM